MLSHKSFFYVSLIIIIAFALASYYALSKTPKEPEFTLTSEEKAYLATLSERPIKLAYSYDLLFSARSNGEIQGMLRPFIELLRDSFGLRIEMKKLDWGEAWNAIDNGSTDFYGLIGLTPARIDKYYETDPIFEVDVQIVSRYNDLLGSLINLRNKKIGVLEQSMLSEPLQSYLYPDGELVCHPTMDAMIQSLAEGNIDCFATVDNAEIEILKYPNIHYEFTVQNFSVNQGFISGKKELEPLAEIINRYLKTSSNKKKIVDAVNKARKEEIMRSMRAHLSNKIDVASKKHSYVRIFDNEVLFPLSYWEDGVKKGMLTEIVDTFQKLTALHVRAERIDEDKLGLKDAVELVRSGKGHVLLQIYPEVSEWNDVRTTYSQQLWTVNLRPYIYGTNHEKIKKLKNPRIGTFLSTTGYIHWDLSTENKPTIYKSCPKLIDALRNGEIDIAFFGDMVFNYYYTILKDYNIREYGSAHGSCDLRMLFHTENTELNELMCDSVRLYHALNPRAKMNWHFMAEQYKSDYMRIRDSQNRQLTIIAGVFIILIIAIVILALRYKKYDSNVRQLIERQQTFDLAWGNIKTKRFQSKGNHPFFRKWGLKFSSRNIKMDELERELGWDLYADYVQDMKSMREKGVDYVIVDKSIISHVDGSRKWYRRFLHRLGKNRFMSCLEDITNEKEAVMQERFLEAILNASSDGIIAITDGDERPLHYNSRLLHMFPHQAASIPKEGLDISSLQEKGRVENVDALLYAMRLMKETNEPQEGTLRFQDGRVFDWSGVSIATNRGTSGFTQIWTFRNVTDRIQKIEAEQASLAKTKFLAHMSSELRTPLYGVIGVTELLLDTDLAPKQREFIELAKNSGMCLLSLLDDILDFSRIDSGQLMLEITEFDLPKMIESALSILAPFAVKRNLNLSAEYKTHLPKWLFGDEWHLRRILINLLSNGIEYTEKGSVTLIVSVLSTQHYEDRIECNLQFEIVDTGVGIPTEKMNSLFLLFSQIDTSSAKKQSGIGMGLAITKKLVDLMDGNIDAESQENIGSKFRFVVPVCFARKDSVPPQIIHPTFLPATKAESDKPTIRIPQDSSAQNENSPFILLVEDNRVDQIVACEVLKNAGFRFDVAENGKEACDAIIEHKYNLLLMDCRMPVMDGFEATIEIRKMESEGKAKHSGRIPIVALTANALHGDEKSCLDVGMDAFCAKPISSEKLIGTIQKQLAT